jgi:hypothetical protein
MKSKILLALFFTLFISTSVMSKAQFKVLFVNDNSLFASNTDTVLYALNHTGYTIDVFNAVDSLRSPTATEMGQYNLVIWYCSTDGVGNYFWNGDDSDNAELSAYLETGGMLWVMGTDFLYDRYSAPHTFIPGDFVYDYLGTLEYHAQSYGDDGGLGVEQLDLSSSGFTSIQTIHWTFPTAWWVDACSPLSSATSIYTMGPSGYVFDSYNSAIWYSSSGHTVLSFFFDPALIDTYANREILFEEIISHFQLFAGFENEMIIRGKTVLYPNPARDVVHVSVPTNMNDDQLDLKISDLSGRCILSKNIAISNNEFDLKISDIPTGIYILRISNTRVSVTCSLVISR